MEHIRLSAASDIPAMRELWALAFGDSGPYVDNFFENYYRPERMIVLEENGTVRAMTAWFDTSFVIPGDGAYRAAYLYAVATHPEHRSRGLSARLLKWADGHFRTLRIPAVTPVPATPSLHSFIAANGFRECFTHSELTVASRPHQTALPITPISAAEYALAREEFLAQPPHIFLPEEAVAYQQGCSRISGGGLYRITTSCGSAILCSEGMEDGSLLVKELLGQPSACEEVVKNLHSTLPGFSGKYRIPGQNTLFGMLKWLDKSVEVRWNWADRAYLGLAFD